MYCIKCGKQIPDSAQYCPFCGAACPAVDAQSTPADTPAEVFKPRLPSDTPVTAADTPSETADSAAISDAPGKEPTASSSAEPVLESAPSGEPAAPDRETPATESVASFTNPADHNRPLLKWIYIGLGAVACVALVFVIWSVAFQTGTPSPTAKTVLPQGSISGNVTQPQQTPQTPSVTPKTTVPGVSPKVTVPNTTPGVTTPGASANTPEDAVPGAGETLYVGHSSYDDISDVKLRFILSADHTKIHDISIACEGLSGKIQSSASNTSVSISKVTQMFQGEYPINYGGTTTEIKLGSSTITSLTFSGETARAELDYTYHMTGTGTNMQDVDIPFGTTWFDLTTEQ